MVLILPKRGEFKNAKDLFISLQRNKQQRVWCRSSKTRSYSDVFLWNFQKIDLLALQVTLSDQSFPKADLFSEILLSFKCITGYQFKKFITSILLVEYEESA